MKQVTNFFKSIINACPYSIVGKTCVNVVKGRTIDKKKHLNKVMTLRKGIKTGTNIALVGVFCPFLWYAIFTGQPWSFIVLNIIHSGFVVVIGVLVVLVNYLALIYFRKQNRT